MSHRPSRRRNTAPPEPTPPSASAPAKHPKPTTTKNTIFSPSPSHSHYPKPNQDLIQATKSSFLVKPFQSLNLELEKWKLQGLLKNEKKESYKGCVVEDVKVEKTRKVEEGDVVKERVSVSLGQSGGRRRSLCGSMIELGDFFAINGAKMVSADMPPFMQIHAVDCARKAFDSMEKFTSKTLALSLKKV
ncbi:dynein light chain [Trifolium pratense]|uniref:Dynein light chain n=1 Tax=Trifolium pratense TaxID=57577 RepID=A0A2K3M6J5_TRIPR|nr:dynein light chain [Trifolium pratense]